MEPLPPKQKARLFANHLLQRAVGSFGQLVDLHPVVRLSLPSTSGYWLISELDPHDQDCFFGLCATGRAPPYLGHGSLSAISALALQQGLALERENLRTRGGPLSLLLKQARGLYMLQRYEVSRADIPREP